jgi:competence protein ComGC
MIVVVIIGLLAMLALPGWQRVRKVAQDKAVLNNARQLSAGADQYYLETGGNYVDLASLVGSSNYVKVLNTVAAEIYPAFFPKASLSPSPALQVLARLHTHLDRGTSATYKFLILRHITGMFSLSTLLTFERLSYIIKPDRIRISP